MWLVKIKLKHDCIIGNRCETFGITLQSLDLTEEKKDGKVITSSIHQLLGEPKEILRFVADLKKDPNTKYVELNGNSLFLVDTARKKPVSEFSKRMFYVKPVIIDTQGYEHWEIASHQKEELMKFIQKVKPLMDEFELLTLKNTPLQQVYFPKVMPDLTELQKKALELAVKEGYYQAPKKIGLRQLAKIMKISLATYQKHLQKAESKVIPDVLSLLR
ncbi:MAG TPA: helix-turn-helix domain-containing protein [Candidatus Nanoarchaeia archaeon]|nr:helix-turn-helix domain-containing protein [Candidatus Nanoarchaeia archaeon]